MPYIEPQAREVIDKWLEQYPGVTDWGEINYAVTRLLLRTCPMRYSQYQAIIGLLECCKLEMYRRAVADYEDEKCDENGDVFYELPPGPEEETGRLAS